MSDVGADGSRGSWSAAKWCPEPVDWSSVDEEARRGLRQNEENWTASPMISSAASRISSPMQAVFGGSRQGGSVCAGLSSDGNCNALSSSASPSCHHWLTAWTTKKAPMIVVTNAVSTSRMVLARRFRLRHWPSDSGIPASSSSSSMGMRNLCRTAMVAAAQTAAVTMMIVRRRLPGIAGAINRTGSAAITPPEMVAHRTRPRVTA